jgi:hypothetical protein
MVMTTECPSVTALMIALPVSGCRPRGWSGARGPVSWAVVVAVGT